MAITLKDLDYSIVQQCMHCGMCLPSCPTYLETGRERNSPRGRLALMRAVADGELKVTPAFGEEMSYCLGCLACTTACPAGVDYGHLLEHSRNDIEIAGALPGAMRKIWRALTLRCLFRSQRLLRFTGSILRTFQRTGLDRFARKTGLIRLLPPPLSHLEPLTPRIAPRFSDRLIEEVETPSTEARHRVGMLTGCIQDLVYPDVNRDTVEVLLANGCEVVTPRAQGCCGSIHAHNGDLQTARQRARALLDVFNLDSLDAVISNAAGCGSHLKHLARLLDDDPAYRGRARQWDAKLKDTTEWLVAIGFRKPHAETDQSTPCRATYHDACHLCHGQGISSAPREILASLPGFEWVEMKDATRCCGAAGIYRLTHPETSERLLSDKLATIHASEAQVVAMANPGCHLQIDQGLQESSKDRRTKVRHVVSLLADAYRQQQKPERGHILRAGSGNAERCKTVNPDT